MKTKIKITENHYICPDCGEEWCDIWNCICKDHCPECNAEVEPTNSRELNENEFGIL